MRKKVFIVLAICLSLASLAQHRAMYSQYIFNGLLINPAYAGSNDVLSVTGISRNQWMGFDGAPRTTTFSMHTPLRDRKVNVGLTFINDQFGITKQNKISGVYTYRLFLDSASLSFGLQGGINMVRNNWDNIHTTNAGDLVFTGQYTQQNIPEAGFGIYFKHKQYYAGASAPTLIALKGIGGENYKPLLISAGCLIPVSDELKIKPSAVAKCLRHSPVELDLTANLYFKAFGVGASYRTGDAMVFMASYNINQQFTVGYAYDLTVSKLRTYVRSSHEIMLKYEFGFKVNPQSPRYF
jgi:type IX secretion system PorP/SprF family membrane protein